MWACRLQALPDIGCKAYEMESNFSEQTHGWSLAWHRTKSGGNGINYGLLLQQRTKPK